MEILKLFYLMRIIYAVIILGIVVGTVLWGIKSGQFRKGSQKKASNLPLEIENDHPESKTKENYHV